MNPKRYLPTLEWYVLTPPSTYSTQAVSGVPDLLGRLSSDPAVAWKLPVDARRHPKWEKTATACAIAGQPISFGARHIHYREHQSLCQAGKAPVDSASPRDANGFIVEI